MCKSALGNANSVLEFECFFPRWDQEIIIIYLLEKPIDEVLVVFIYD